MTNDTKVIIRPATMEDIQGMYELQMHAFNDKFQAAFGQKNALKGVAALIRVHQLQGPKSLQGMYVAQREHNVVGTITMRVSEMRFDDGLALERALIQELGAWGSFRAMNALSQLEHRIGRREAYLTDIAVAPELRRQGIATIMIQAIAGKAREHDKTCLSLYVSKSNKNARDLYYKLGFRDQYTRSSWWNALMLKQRRWVFMTCPLL